MERVQILTIGGLPFTQKVSPSTNLVQQLSCSTDESLKILDLEYGGNISKQDMLY